VQPVPAILKIADISPPIPGMRLANAPPMVAKSPQRPLFKSVAVNVICSEPGVASGVAGSLYTTPIMAGPEKVV
jgi:hypothetical protein